jgi:hypothetical protein
LELVPVEVTKEPSGSLICQEDVTNSPEKPKIQLPTYYVEQEKLVLENFNTFMKKSIELLSKSIVDLKLISNQNPDDRMQVESTNNANLQPLLSPRLSQTPTSPTFATPQIKAAKRTLFPTTNIISSVTHTINIGSNAREDNATTTPSVS